MRTGSTRSQANRHGKTRTLRRWMRAPLLRLNGTSRVQWRVRSPTPKPTLVRRLMSSPRRRTLWHHRWRRPSFRLCKSLMLLQRASSPPLHLPTHPTRPTRHRRFLMHPVFSAPLGRMIHLISLKRGRGRLVLPLLQPSRPRPTRASVPLHHPSQPLLILFLVLRRHPRHPPTRLQLPTRSSVPLHHRSQWLMHQPPPTRSSLLLRRW